MIVEYHRPTSVQQALQLLARPQPLTRPLGGGSTFVQPSAEPVAVVDVQALGLNHLEAHGKTWRLGAALTLQALLEAFEPGGLLSGPALAGLRQALLHEASQNVRQAATVAGALVACDGRSPFATAMLAADAELSLLPGPQTLAVGEVLLLRQQLLPGKLITHFSLPVAARVRYACVARTPADRPVVCAALAHWPSGRTRLALGGFGLAPTLAFDGSEPGGLETAAASAYAQAGDAWATAEYRSAMAAVLARRCLDDHD